MANNSTPYTKGKSRSYSSSLRDNNGLVHIKEELFRESNDVIAMTPRQENSFTPRENDGSSILSTRTPQSRPNLVSPMPPLLFDEIDAAKPPKKKRKCAIKENFPSLPGLEEDFSREAVSNVTANGSSSTLILQRKQDEVEPKSVSEILPSIYGEIENEDNEERYVDNDDEDDAVIRNAASILCLLKSASLPASFTLDDTSSSYNSLGVRSKNIQHYKNKCDDTFKSERNENSIQDHQLNYGQPRQSCENLPDRLALDQDSHELNSLHCFVRSDLLELFTVCGKKKHSAAKSAAEEEDEDDDSVNIDDVLQNNCPRSSLSEHEEIVSIVLSEQSTNNMISSKCGIDMNGASSTRLFPGRVGLRCIYCGHIPRKAIFGKASMSTFYPKSLADLYRSVCTWQRVHFRSCRHIPYDVKEKYWSLKDSDRSRGKTKYWITSARKLGLIDSDGIDGRGGICFA